MRKSLCASVLVLALCGSAFATDGSGPPTDPGDIPSPPKAVQSFDDGTTEDQPDAADGVIQGDEMDGLTEAALSVLNSVLALF